MGREQLQPLKQPRESSMVTPSNRILIPGREEIVEEPPKILIPGYWEPARSIELLLGKPRSESKANAQLMSLKPIAAAPVEMAMPETEAQRSPATEVHQKPPPIETPSIPTITRVRPQPVEQRGQKTTTSASEITLPGGVKITVPDKKPSSGKGGTAEQQDSLKELKEWAHGGKRPLTEQGSAAPTTTGGVGGGENQSLFKRQSSEAADGSSGGKEPPKTPDPPKSGEQPVREMIVSPPLAEPRGQKPAILPLSNSKRAEQMVSSGVRNTQPKEPPDLHIEIGNPTDVLSSDYVLSSEAQKYLRVAAVSNYKKRRAVIIVGEPHWGLEKQFNLYKGLEIFFRDNPSLIPKTVFLLEGFPADQPFPLQPLISKFPNPSEEVIWEALSTFLVSGDMAYEWKYQHGIPIIGTENHALHQLSAKLYLIMEEGQIARAFNMTVVARNKAISTTVINQVKKIENPMLFVGGGHLSKLSFISMMAIRVSHPENSLSSEEASLLKDWKNLGIQDYLAKEKIGYTFIATRNLLNEDRHRDRFDELFAAQEQGNSEPYIAKLISGKIWSVVVVPSSEDASQFLETYFKKRPVNPEASIAAERAFSLTADERFIEAAEEFSAASAAEPRVSSYVTHLQDSLFKETVTRANRVLRGSNTALPDRTKSNEYTINTSVPSDLPVYGPYIEKNHNEQVTHFAQRFAQIPGTQWVINNGKSRQWEDRYGGILQVKTAERIGPEQIRGFGEQRQIEGFGGEIASRVDLGTKDHTAIICKNFPLGKVPVFTIYNWVKQAAYCLEPDVKGYKYKAVLIVIPDNAKIEEFTQAADGYLKLNYPDYLGKIRICRVSQINEGQQKAVPKSGVVFDASQQERAERGEWPNWFKISPEEEKAKIREKYKVDSIWELLPIFRGRAYEFFRDAEPASNLKHIDDIRLKARTVTGIKTIDLRDKSYLDPHGLEIELRKDIDELIGYPGGTWKKRPFTRGEDFDKVYLEIGIPAGKASPAQVKKLLEMQDYARNKNITLVIAEIP